MAGAAAGAAATSSVPSDEVLDRMQLQADQHADSTIHNIVEDWQPPQLGAALTVASIRDSHQLKANFDRLRQVTALFPDWTNNDAVWSWPQEQRAVPPELNTRIAAYLAASRDFPAWGDKDKVRRAEEIFMDYGALSVTLLFCSSLPECYVVPDLSAVLQATGQLIERTEHRIRATGAMIFPVMMRGGMLDAEGGGVAQIFKVRLIHATVRNLILRNSPEQVMKAVAAEGQGVGAGVIEALAAIQPGDDMFPALYAHGWNVDAKGLPCNQEELAYTLLTFSYVFLRSMRKLGLGLSADDEQACLHAWNVAGHYLGIDRSLMVDTMEEAEQLFAKMQARGRADWAHRPEQPDPRPQLGQALMAAMQSVIPDGPLKSFPILMTRFLCGPDSSKDLGLDQQVSWLSRALFRGTLLITRGIDVLVRLVFPEFSLARFFTRLLGYQLVTKLMMDQTRPLKLPTGLRGQLDSVVASWSNDSHAPAWLNAVEDRFTVKGAWQAGPRK
jgi:hypothetical protein